MKEENLDTTGLKCPLPVLEIAKKVATMKPGDILEVRGDCPTFERDVREYCERVGKTIVSISRIWPHTEYGKIIRIRI